MKKTIFIEGREDYVTFLREIFKVTNLDFEIFTENDLTSGKYYDYSIMDCNAKEKNIILNSSYCFVNMDNVYNPKMDIYGNLVTYGLGSKNTVTVSSIENENNSFVYCLQRYLNHNSLGMIMPEELPITMHFKNDVELYASMVGVTIALIEGIDIYHIRERLSRIKNEAYFVFN